MPRTPSEHDARQALSDHVAQKAAAARARYGPRIDADAVVRMLGDRDVVRYPVSLCFDAGPLREGEFAWAAPLGEPAADGFRLCVHPWFERRREAWPLLLAYHIPAINYGDIVTPADCEVFAAGLLGLDRDEYYRALCGLVDSIPVAAADGRGDHAGPDGPPPWSAP